MIQEIYPHQLDNTYRNQRPTPQDFILLFSAHRILLKGKEEARTIPKGSDLETQYPEIYLNCRYLFSIDEAGFFLAAEEGIKETKELLFADISVFRSLSTRWQAFAGVTGAQLSRWYQNHIFCGRCGEKMKHSDKERALYCSSCGNVVYPKLSPAVIVGITDGDKILLTRYANSNINNYALVAGYVEVGETLEETVHREVLEEVGLRVKNISYYKSQPWGFSDSLLVGYFAELEGSNEVTLQEEELGEGTWFKREEIPVEPNYLSMTNEMIQVFKNGSIQEKE